MVHPLSLPLGHIPRGLRPLGMCPWGRLAGMSQTPYPSGGVVKISHDSLNLSSTVMCTTYPRNLEAATLKGSRPFFSMYLGLDIGRAPPIRPPEGEYPSSFNSKFIQFIEVFSLSLYYCPPFPFAETTLAFQKALLLCGMRERERVEEKLSFVLFPFFHSVAAASLASGNAPHIHLGAERSGNNLEVGKWRREWNSGIKRAVLCFASSAALGRGGGEGGSELIAELPIYLPGK